MHQSMFRDIIVKAFKYFSVCYGNRMTDVSTCQRFAKNQNIRKNQVRHKTVACPTKSRRHLIKDQKDTILVAELSRLL